MHSLDISSYSRGEDSRYTNVISRAESALSRGSFLCGISFYDVRLVKRNCLYMILVVNCAKDLGRVCWRIRRWSLSSNEKQSLAKFSVELMTFEA